MSEGDNSDDSDLFKKEMESQGVRKTTRSFNSITHDKPKPSGSPRRRTVAVGFTGSQISTSRPSLPASAIDSTSAGQPVLFVRQGADKNTVRAFKRGDIPIDETIDLHGMRERQAQRALVDLFSECRQYQWHCVQIIHGKGRNSEQPGGVLKPLTLHWLKLQEEVAAFCSASDRQGGTGATNVLLTTHARFERSD